MPRRAVRRRVHAKTDRARRVTFPEQLGDLPVRHHSSTRNASHDGVNALSIFWVRLFHLFLRRATRVCTTLHARAPRRQDEYANAAANRSVHTSPPARYSDSDLRE